MVASLELLIILIYFNLILLIFITFYFFLLIQQLLIRLLIILDFFNFTIHFAEFHLIIDFELILLDSIVKHFIKNYLIIVR